jgi:predicted small metal-binding protein
MWLALARASITLNAQPPAEELIMARKYIDCREFPSDTKCSVTIAADSEQELMAVAVQHAVSVHGHRDTPEFREQLKQTMHEGQPPG